LAFGFAAGDGAPTTSSVISAAQRTANRSKFQTWRTAWLRIVPAGTSHCGSAKRRSAERRSTPILILRPQSRRSPQVRDKGRLGSEPVEPAVEPAFVLWGGGGGLAEPGAAGACRPSSRRSGALPCRHPTADRCRSSVLPEQDVVGEAVVGTEHGFVVGRQMLTDLRIMFCTLALARSSFSLSL